MDGKDSERFQVQPRRRILMLPYREDCYRGMPLSNKSGRDFNLLKGQKHYPIPDRQVEASTLLLA